MLGVCAAPERVSVLRRVPGSSAGADQRRYEDDQPEKPFPFPDDYVPFYLLPSGWSFRSDERVVPRRLRGGPGGSQEPAAARRQMGSNLR